MQCEYMRHNAAESRPIFTFAMGEDDQRPMEHSAERSDSIPRGQVSMAACVAAADEHHTGFFGYLDRRYFG
jgi:hypothetical protein